MELRAWRREVTRNVEALPWGTRKGKERLAVCGQQHATAPCIWLNQQQSKAVFDMYLHQWVSVRGVVKAPDCSLSKVTFASACFVSALMDCGSNDLPYTAVEQTMWSPELHSAIRAEEMAAMPAAQVRRGRSGIPQAAGWVRATVAITSPAPAQLQAWLSNEDMACSLR